LTVADSFKTFVSVRIVRYKVKPKQVVFAIKFDLSTYVFGIWMECRASTAPAAILNGIQAAPNNETIQDAMEENF
jgi:hypothetical protein